MTPPLKLKPKFSPCKKTLLNLICENDIFLLLL